LIPGVFGINEPIFFGLPNVLNTILLNPFVLVPAINFIIAYFAMDWGLVPLTNGIQMTRTTTPIISGFFDSGLQGSILK
ncbi:PTS cellobiose transporter subunit IIC, partial [Enterococcus faecalis]